MAFTRTRSELKALLPKWCFILLYELASSVYRGLRKISDDIYYLGSYVYYVLRRDSKNIKRIRTICLIRPYTMVGRTGLLTTYDIANELEKNKIGGCFVECGVARGGCSALMAIAANESRSGRKVWLFYSFEGLPDPTVEDESSVVNLIRQDKNRSALQKGYCLGTYEQVSKLLFSILGLDKENIVIVKGWFQDTLPNYKGKIEGISFLRIDGDWYQSTQCCLDNLYDDVITGGYILIDDYHLPGCKKAVDEFLQKKGREVKFTFDGRGGVYFVKP